MIPMSNYSLVFCDQNLPTPFADVIFDRPLVFCAEFVQTLWMDASE